MKKLILSLTLLLSIDTYALKALCKVTAENGPKAVSIINDAIKYYEYSPVLAHVPWRGDNASLDTLSIPSKTVKAELFMPEGRPPSIIFKDRKGFVLDGGMFGIDRITAYDFVWVEQKTDDVAEGSPRIYKNLGKMLGCHESNQSKDYEMLIKDNYGRIQKLKSKTDSEQKLACVCYKEISTDCSVYGCYSRIKVEGQYYDFDRDRFTNTNIMNYLAGERGEDVDEEKTCNYLLEQLSPVCGE